MASVFPRVYRSFEEFERSELQKLDQLYGSVDDMVDDLLMNELEEEYSEREDGILFDSIEDCYEDDEE